MSGNEKYQIIRNIIAIAQFVKGKRVDVDNEINSIFGKDTVKRLKENSVSKKEIIKKYLVLYIKTRKIIEKGIRNESK